MSSNSKMDKDNKLDQWVMGLAALAFIIFLFFLYTDFWMVGLDSGSSGKNKIGFADKMKRDVRRRAQDEFIWLPLNDKHSLFFGDSLFTGSKSGVDVVLDSGVKLSLGADSLLVLNGTSEMTKLDVRFGSIAGVLNQAKNEPLKVRFGDQEVDLKGQKVEFQVENTTTSLGTLQIINGEADISRGQEKLKLSKNQSVKMSRSLASVGPLVPVDAIPNSGFVNMQDWSGSKEVWLNQKGNVTFDWETSKFVDKTEIVIGTTESLENPLKKELVTGDRYRWKPPHAQGEYYWKLRSFDKNGALIGETPINLWKIGLLEAPRWVDPQNPLYLEAPSNKLEPQGEDREKDAKLRRVLRWSASGRINNYELEWSKDFDFQKNERVPIKEDSWTVPSWPLGRYFVRVRSEAMNRPASPWSETQVIEISDLDPDGLVSPQFLGENLQSWEGIESIPLQWKPQEKTRTYQLEVAESNTFATLLDSQKIEGERWIGLRPKKGQYFIRVIPLSDKGRRGPTSKILSWEVKVSEVGAPQLLANQLSSIKKGDGYVSASLGWKALPQIKKYRIQLSGRDTFKTVISEKTVSTLSYAFKVKESSTYYLRVAGEGGDGQLGPWSRSVPWEVQEGAPVLLPIPALKINLGSRTGGVPPKSIPVRWKAPKSLQRFRLELASDKSFSNLLSDTNVKGTSSEINLAKEGSYWVRVTGVDDKNNRKSETSDPVPAKYLVVVPIARPVLQSPRDKVSYILSKMKNPQVWLEWQGDKEAKKYRIEFAANRTFSRVLHTMESKEERFLVDHNTVRGKLYWRVQGQNEEKGVNSPWSDSWSLSVVDIENDD